MINKILDKLSKKEKNILNKEILSPFVKGRNSIQLRIEDILYSLKIPPMLKDGIGIFKAIDPSNAIFVRDADFIETKDYLELLPKTSFILVYNVGKWLAYPYNVASFKQQFGKEPNLTTLFMVEDAEFLDSVEARFDGANFWFNGVKFLTGSEKKDELRNNIKNFKYSISSNLTKGMTPEEKIVFSLASDFHKEANKSNLERKLEIEFSKCDANVDSFVERNGLVEVRWRDNINAKTYTSILDKDNMSVVTAGICLSGGDKKFDLQSLVMVCRQANKKGSVVHIGNGGMEEDRYWDMYGDRYE